MKRLYAAVLCTILVLPLAAQAQGAVPGATSAPAATAADGFSYALGMLMAGSVKSAGLDINYDDFMAGLRDLLGGAGTRLTEAQAQAAVQAAVESAKARKANGNLAAGQAFLAANRGKPGVKVTASGLQYEVLSLGNGPMPTASDAVTVHYEGRLLDGTVFDSSYSRGAPATFRLDQVIRGWTEGLQLMPVGSRFRFYIPAELAYGARGAGSLVGPNAVLVFEVELIAMQK